jgi:uncharacterized protein YggT (Ycf19 family)
MLSILGLLSLLIALDVALAWVQPDPSRPPRRWTHALTEPLMRPVRRLLPAARTGGWDLSPLVWIAVLGAIRVLIVSG